SENRHPAILLAMTLSMSPSAVCQCFTLVSLCTSIADPNWIQVRNSTDPEGKQLIYGVAFTLHVTLLIDLFHVALCVPPGPSFSTFSFLSPVAFLLSVLGVCGACLYVIYCNLQEDKFVLMGDWVGGWTWPRSGFRSRGRGGSAGMQLYPGESFYIAMLSLLFSCVGSVISLRGPGNPASTQREHTAVVEGDDSDTEPLIPRGHGVGQSDKDSRGEEVFPELTQGEVDTAERLSV
uniref:Uncharacterized protein n=1 Tax=Esox lucius TaxID=8010 RepID=A0AAY5LBQ2_ESOLU